MTADSASNLNAELAPPDGTGESPLHGFQGDRRASRRSEIPASLTVALSRESGSRGTSIARRVGRKLGWQVYTQELLDYIVHEGADHSGVLAHLPAEAVHWAEGRIDCLVQERKISTERNVLDLARVILALGAQGDAVLVGRGAGYLLPHETTLHVRVVAPLPDRIAYMSQWLRLTMEEAAEQVRLLDRRRSDFMQTHFHHSTADVYPYDLLLNSSLLGEETCVALIAQAARAKLAARGHATGALPPGVEAPAPY